MIYLQFLAPVISYYVRMAIRYPVTQTWIATNWVDIANLVNWIFWLVVLIFPAIMYPLYWLDDLLINFLTAWYTINILADLIPIYYVAFFIMNLIIAASSGVGTQTVCDIYNNCYYDDHYVDVGDALASMFVWLFVNAATYFAILWFGADAVRVLVPQGGYDLYFLWPNSIYGLMVISGASP